MKKRNLLVVATKVLFVLSLTACSQISSLIPPQSPAAGSTSQPVLAQTATQLLPQAILSEADTTVTPAPTSSSGQGQAPQYYSPLKDANYVSTGATITVRFGPQLTAAQAAGINFSVAGSQSGPHSGQTILADDHTTVIFKPSQRFTPGEQVNVTIGGLQIDSQTSYGQLSYAFNVAAHQTPGGVGISPTLPDTPPAPAFPNALTIPQDIPHFTITANSPDTGEGYIFVAPLFWTKSTLGSYLLILDQQGQLVYYQPVAADLEGFDFKVQPNGLLSYFDLKDATFYLLDSHYQTVATYQAGNGYTADLHDLQVLPNGNVLLMVYDNEVVDMSKVVAGGNSSATVTGLVIQEIDPSKNVVFEWRSWDHFSFTDSTASLTDQNIDLVHGNSVFMMNDGNLLLSSRNLSELTKINLQTGDIIWRLGGKSNQFTFVNDQPFAFQHNASQLPNGDITLFDNHGTQQAPAASRAVEYKLDETKKTATMVWQYAHQTALLATFMGNIQRFANGNSFVDWGAPYQDPAWQWATITEVSPTNQVLFELAFDQSYVSYRAFRFPWTGSPATLPSLAFKTDAAGLTLGYSWNGATEVAAYQVYGGSSVQALKPVDKQTKAGFETQSHLANLQAGECYFQAAALDKNGQEMARSAIVSTDSARCPLNP